MTMKMNELAAGGGISNPALGNTLKGLLEGENAGTEFLKIILPNFVGLSLVIGVLIFFAVMIIGAIQWVSSGGDKVALEGARGKIANALVGIILLFATFAIVKVIEDFFGVNILTLDIGPLKIE